MRNHGQGLWSKSMAGKDAKHKWAVLRNMVTDLIKHERIETTLPKAKMLRQVADKVVTMGKEGTPAARARAAAIVRTEPEVHKLFTELADRYENREGGYTRVLRTRRRIGDAAQMAYIEYVDRPGELRPCRPAKGGNLLPAAAAAAAELA